MFLLDSLMIFQLVRYSKARGHPMVIYGRTGRLSLLRVLRMSNRQVVCRGSYRVEFLYDAARTLGMSIRQAMRRKPSRA
jgi:hypothetical protein